MSSRFPCGLPSISCGGGGRVSSAAAAAAHTNICNIPTNQLLSLILGTTLEAARKYGVPIWREEFNTGRNNSSGQLFNCS